MRYFLDTEFDDNGRTIELISIGIVGEDGREFYRISNEFDPEACNPWVKQNVLNQLTGPRHARSEIRDGIKAFISGDSLPDFWGYFADYDWVVFCQLFGTMLSLPAGWPNMCMDVKQLAIHMGMPHINKIVPPPDDAHNALSDAKWTMEMYKKLVGFREKR
jgi:hypothetical protein